MASTTSGPADAGLVPLQEEPETPSLIELNTRLDEFSLLSRQITNLKREAADKDAFILKEILEKITPLVPLLSRDLESYCRCELVILTKEERIQFENVCFYSEWKLILYENGSLVWTHRYGDTSPSRIGWVLTDEIELDPRTAITAFGLSAIVKGLIETTEKAGQLIVIKGEAESRLTALTKILEAL